MQPSNVYYGSGAPPVMGGGKSSSRRRLFILVGIILIIITIVLGIVASVGGTSKGSASGVSKQMISLIGLGKGVESYELLSAQGKQSISNEEWVTFVVTNKANIGEKPEVKLAYSSKQEDGSIQEAYNVGKSGAIYRVLIVVKSEEKKIESIRINGTSL